MITDLIYKIEQKQEKYDESSNKIKNNLITNIDEIKKWNTKTGTIFDIIQQINSLEIMNLQIGKLKAMEEFMKIINERRSNMSNPCKEDEKLCKERLLELDIIQEELEKLI